MNKKEFKDLMVSVELVDEFFFEQYPNDYKIWKNKTALWFTVKNPMLGGAVPMELFYRGRGHKVLSFIKGALSENKCDLKMKGRAT